VTGIVIVDAFFWRQRRVVDFPHLRDVSRRDLALRPSLVTAGNQQQVSKVFSGKAYWRPR